MCGEWEGWTDQRGSTAADSNHDFKAVAVEELRRAMLASGHNLAVSFNGDALAGQIERVDQLAKRQRGGKGTGFAVDDQMYHGSFADCGGVSV